MLKVNTRGAGVRGVSLVQGDGRAKRRQPCSK